MKTIPLSSTIRIAAILAFSAMSLPFSTDAESLEIRVDAGTFERHQSIASFTPPIWLEPGVYSASNEEGHSLSVQVDAEQQAWMIIDSLPANSHHVYLMHLARQDRDEVPGVEGVIAKLHADTLELRVGEQPALHYYHSYNEPPEGLDERYRRGAYIHPVHTPSGTVLTHHLNPDMHPHHSGIWSAWTQTRYRERRPDFWNIHNDSGRVDHKEGLEAIWQGPVFGGFRAIHLFTDLSAPTPETVLREMWEVRVYKTKGDYHLFDLTSTQSMQGDTPLILPEYHYGGIGFRGHKDWNDPENCTFLTSDGLGRDGHGTRVRWTHIGGMSEEKLAGIAILGHPANFRHPQPVRIHPTEPFFNYAPQQLGEMRIQPGIPYRASYRYVAYDGEPDPEKLERLWNDYAYPPGITVRLLKTSTEQ